MDATSVAISLGTGLVGCAYFMYGKKQKKAVALSAGILMCVLPYMLTDNLTTIIICVIAAIVPWVVRV